MQALADKWQAVLDECKAADPRWILDQSVTTLETALRELRALLADADISPRCHCGKYPVDPDHCLTLFDRDDTAVERHAVGACEGDAR